MFNISRTILFGDCDPAGFIYTPRIGHFVVEAALEFQTALFNSSSARKMLSIGLLPPTKQLNIEFFSPLVWDERIDIEVACVHIGSTSFTCEVVAKKEGEEVVFVGKLTQVCIDKDTKRPVEIPLEIRSALQKGIR